MSHFSLCATRHLRGYPCRLFELLVYPLTHIFPFHRCLEKKGKRSQEKFLWSSGATEYKTAQHFTPGQTFKWSLTLAAPWWERCAAPSPGWPANASEFREGYLGSRIHIMVRYILRLYGAHTILKASRNCVCLHVVQCRTVTCIRASSLAANSCRAFSASSLPACTATSSSENCGICLKMQYSKLLLGISIYIPQNMVCTYIFKLLECTKVLA